MKIGSVFIAILIFVASFFTIVHADELEDITKQRQELENLLNLSQKATTTNEQELNKLNQQLNSIITKVNHLEKEVAKKEKEVKEGEKVLIYQKNLLDERAISYYKNLNNNSIDLVQFLIAENLSDSLQNFFYQKTLQDRDRQTIIKIVMYIKNLEETKRILQNETKRLASIKEQVNQKSQFLAGEVTKSKKYEGDLQKKIAELSARQQEILNSRSGSFTASIGDSELADDYNASIKGFREAAPGGYFAIFAFGAHTHRKGMSQYGARGRAQNGQNYREILRAYYGKEPTSKDTGGDINVSGYGSMNFEEKYLYGIAEMPSSWHPEALKAQAIAARTYAYRFKQDGREICTSEACQVFSMSKAENPPEAWKNAVNNTRGQVVEDVVTYYASTHGVYIASPAMWDTTDAGSGSNFVDKSYEKIGGSPWVYKSWYTQGYSVNSDKCGRSNPWLSPEEMADIINAALVLSKGTTDEASRISPVTTSCWGGNPYSHDELRNIASKYGGIGSASSVSVEQGNGTTNRVVINGVSLSGTEFKKGFNLRAPGYMSIPQYQFAFFSIEKK